MTFRWHWRRPPNVYESWPSEDPGHELDADQCCACTSNLCTGEEWEGFYSHIPRVRNSIFFFTAQSAVHIKLFRTVHCSHTPFRPSSQSVSPGKEVKPRGERTEWSFPGPLGDTFKRHAIDTFINKTHTVRTCIADLICPDRTLFHALVKNYKAIHIEGKPQTGDHVMSFVWQSLPELCDFELGCEL